MELHYISREKPENSSFSVTHHKEPNFLKVWHYHPELELILTLKSTGTRFVGDSIKNFAEGDLVLLGKNLPHMWLNDDAYFNKNNNLIAEDIVIHFKKDFLGFDFLNAHEMKPIFNLLEASKYGIKFTGSTEKLSKKITKIKKLQPGFKRTLKFIKLLSDLAHHKQFEFLSSESFVHSFIQNKNSKLDKTYEYIFANFNKEIRLNDIAQIAKMNPTAFSRFFKRVNRKTFSRYLNEVRIGYACKKLIENKSSIASICFESGYNNVSNFNRQFKAIKKMSPRTYLSRYQSNIK